MKPTLEHYVTQTPMKKYLSDNFHTEEKQFPSPAIGYKIFTQHKREFASSPLEQRTSQRGKDFLKLRHCALLHKFLVKILTEHLQEKMIGEPDQINFENIIFDLHIAKRGLKIIERLYRELGLPIENEK